MLVELDVEEVLVLREVLEVEVDTEVDELVELEDVLLVEVVVAPAPVLKAIVANPVEI